MPKMILWIFVWVWQTVASYQVMAQDTPLGRVRMRFLQSENPFTYAELEELKNSASQAEATFKHESSLLNRRKVDDFYSMIEKPTLDTRQLSNWHQTMLTHHENLDQLIILRMAYTVEKAYAQISLKKDRIFPELSTEAQNRIDKQWQRLIQIHTKWRSNFDCIGPRALLRNKDQPQLPVRDRIYGQDKFLREVRYLSQNLDRLPSRMGHMAKKVAKGAAFPFLCVGTGVGCSILSVALLGAKSVQSVGSTFFNKSPVPSPAPSAWMGMLRSFGGNRLKIENRENLLLDDQDPDEVRLYLPPHLDEYRDQLSLAALGIPKPRVFANAGVVGSEVLGKGYGGRMLGGFVASADGLVPVGAIKGFFQNQSTEAHYNRELKKPGTANFFNFSEGFVNRERIPISPRFVDGLLSPPLKAGRKLTIIPLSFHQPNDFLAKPGSIKKFSGPDVTVHRPILSQEILKLAQIRLLDEEGTLGLALIPLAIREMWYTTMQDDLSVEQLELRLDELFVEALPEASGVSFRDSEPLMENG